MRTKIKIREWEDMEKEFGLNEFGDINCIGVFVDTMKYLCGNVYEAELNSYGSGYIGDWRITKDMYAIIDENKGGVEKMYNNIEISKNEKREMEVMSSELLSLITQIERIDYEDRHGQKLIHNKAYIKLLEKYGVESQFK